MAIPFILFIIFVVILFAGSLFFASRFRIAAFLVALLSLALAGFAIFGFLASFEPLPGNQGLYWKFSYVFVFSGAIGCLLFGARHLFRKS